MSALTDNQLRIISRALSADTNYALGIPSAFVRTLEEASEHAVYFQPMLPHDSRPSLALDLNLRLGDRTSIPVALEVGSNFMQQGEKFATLACAQTLDGNF